MPMDFNKIITELCWRLEDGTPDFNNPEHLQELRVVLTMHKWDAPAINELIETLTEEKLYVNNAENRRRGRVGKKWGSSPGDAPKKSSGGSEDDKPEKEPKAEPKQQSNGYVGNKDKTLEQGNPSDTDEYKKDLEPNDQDFNEKNKANANPTPPDPISLEGIVKNPKFPKRYIKVLERMMNTKNNKASSKYEHFSDTKGGAGKISAQAGELMAMMGTSMSDEEFEQFTTALLEHEQELLAEDKARFERGEKPLYHKVDKKSGKLKDNPGSRIINKSWIESAKKTRKVMKDQIGKIFGEGSEVIATAWDASDEVEAMGLKDYKNNKGFSSDMYIKVKKPNGEEVLLEVSLKKDGRVYFLNSGTGKLMEIDPSLVGSAVDPSVYSSQEKTRLASGAAKVLPKKLLDSPDIQNALKVINGEKPSKDHKLKGSARANSKLILKAIIAEADKGNKEAIAYLEADDAAHREMKREVMDVINTNEKVRDGVIENIKDEFPMKAVADGEETMAIGDMSLDRLTMKEVFGTDNFDDLKENFKVVENAKGEPVLVYSVKGKEEIPIAEMGIRQDGRGYGGGTIKFEMALHPELAKKLAAATNKVYG